ncbi:biotin-requiring domain-containing protein [Cryptosporidium muris RN66]|uniref:Biotin-requiring domain-containing protein n=1 Tax=Cryptosporidium muris (strain RN66) TaxID=441375 RepID=B6AFE3_CRYMR|nr:biotin-requiring domain-containing protein [Cryptosporidium muris RN66]EEA06934.1 biotin-requiring domain-containing protein [Cryptosporidium muris RN66]|eukprot:XP_002141283.1 biotin-requiring domain-containing protein [Cryptosporidium muris RN66]
MTSTLKQISKKNIFNILKCIYNSGYPNNIKLRSYSIYSQAILFSHLLINKNFKSIISYSTANDNINQSNNIPNKSYKLNENSNTSIININNTNNNIIEENINNNKLIHLMKVPSVGDTNIHGILTEWKVLEGSQVIEDQIICTIETEEVTIDIHSEVSGNIIKRHIDIGKKVEAGEDLIDIEVSKPSKTLNIVETISNTPTNTNLSYMPKICFEHKISKELKSKIDTPSHKIGIKKIDSSKHEQISDNNISLLKRKEFTEEEIELANLGTIDK